MEQVDRSRMVESFYWVSRDDRKQHIEEMDTNHLKNILEKYADIRYKKSFTYLLASRFGQEQNVSFGLELLRNISDELVRRENIPENFSKDALQGLANHLGIRFEICKVRDPIERRRATIGEGNKASTSFGRTEKLACDKLWEFVKKFYVVIQQ